MGGRGGCEGDCRFNVRMDGIFSFVHHFIPTTYFYFIWVSGILLDGIWTHFIMRKFKKKKHSKVNYALLNWICDVLCGMKVKWIGDGIMEWTAC